MTHSPRRTSYTSTASDTRDSSSNPPAAYTCQHTHTYTHTHTHTHTRIHTHTHTHTHTHAHTQANTRTHSRTRTRTHTLTHIRTHTHTLSLTHTYTHTHTNAHTHTHAHKQKNIEINARNKSVITCIAFKHHEISMRLDTHVSFPPSLCRALSVSLSLPINLFRFLSRVSALSCSNTRICAGDDSEEWHAPNR